MSTETKFEAGKTYYRSGWSGGEECVKSISVIAPICEDRWLVEYFDGDSLVIEGTSEAHLNDFPHATYEGAEAELPEWVAI